MSASELLKHVKAMPTRERQKFLRAVQAMSKQDLSADSAIQSRRNVKWPDVEARAKRNSGGRVLPNLVLMEREEAAS